MPFSYETIRVLFETDDGACPEICLLGLSGEAVMKMYSLVREKARLFAGSPYFFDRRDSTEKLIKSVPNAAELVVNGEAEPFHFLARFLGFGEKPIPELGVFIFSNGVALDYQRGPYWGEDEVKSLFHLMKLVREMNPSMQISLEEEVSPALKKAFSDAFEEYCPSDSKGN